jgi:ribosomal protein S12 methylthiotransferase
MKKKAYYLSSLGCAKNSVDSVSMEGLLQQAGWIPVDKPSRACVLIVNTCGFIKPAREESIKVLQELSAQKRNGQYLIAAGCLSQRMGKEISSLVDGLDGIIGTRRWMDIVSVVDEMHARRSRTPLYHLPDSPTIGRDDHGVMTAAVQGGSAYLKIADGCRRPCAFCAIPIIKGAPVSRTIEQIISEARILVGCGVKEINLIAQDTTDYGFDLGMSDGLPTLLERLTNEVPEIPWIRILYAYPGYVTNHLIDVMKSNPQILPYLDIPLQHADPGILRAMKRPHNIDWVYKTVEKLRLSLPELVLRTTFIVGYPGENEKEFGALLEMVRKIEFDHVGVFPFSFETGTASESLGDPILDEEKQERLQRLMLLQQKISLKRNQTQIGKVLPVLIEGNGQGISVGRSYRDAPEIDGLVIIEDQAQIGEIVPVVITGAMPHDLSGRLARAQ